MTSRRQVSADNRTGAACGAATENGRCRHQPTAGRARCDLHGGLSTGPRTPEGKQRIAEAARRGYLEAAFADGWRLPTPAQRTHVLELKHSLDDSHNATANELGMSRHGVRRVLAGLPLRPDEVALLERRLRTSSERVLPDNTAPQEALVAPVAAPQSPVVRARISIAPPESATRAAKLNEEM